MYTLSSKITKENSKTYESLTDVEYFYMPSLEKSNRLLVIFSGFGGKEEKGIYPDYQLLDDFNDMNINRLYIKDDYSGEPCFYVGRDGLTDYMIGVMNLIYTFSRKLGISLDNIATCGIGKGATGALICGGYSGVGKIFIYNMVMYPKAFLKEKQTSYYDKLLKEIYGEHESQHGHDDIVENVINRINRGNRTKVLVLADKNDVLYHQQLKPYLESRSFENFDIKEATKSNNKIDQFKSSIIDDLDVETKMLQVKVRYKAGILEASSNIENPLQYALSVKNMKHEVTYQTEYQNDDDFIVPIVMDAPFYVTYSIKGDNFELPVDIDDIKTD